MLLNLIMINSLSYHIYQNIILKGDIKNTHFLCKYSQDHSKSHKISMPEIQMTQESRFLKNFQNFITKILQSHKQDDIRKYFMKSDADII